MLAALLMCAAALICACTVTDVDYDARLVFLEAGQGDSSLIMTSDGSSVLIDTGAPGYTDKVVASLLKHGVSTIDVLVLTHYHEDHVAGTVQILESFNVMELWCIEDDENYITTSIKGAAKENGTEICYVDEGKESLVGKDDQVLLKVLCVYTEGDKGAENENAIVLSASCLDFSALYMSDTGHKTEEYLIEKYGDEISCNVLKVGHHGSNTSSSEEFVSCVDPQIAVVSCEKNNPYGHPHTSTMEILEKYCEYTVYTYDGDFELFVKGSEIIFENNT